MPVGLPGQPASQLSGPFSTAPVPRTMCPPHLHHHVMKLQKPSIIMDNGVNSCKRHWLMKLIAEAFHNCTCRQTAVSAPLTRHPVSYPMVYLVLHMSSTPYLWLHLCFTSTLLQSYLCPSTLRAPHMCECLCGERTRGQFRVCHMLCNKSVMSQHTMVVRSMSTFHSCSVVRKAELNRQPRRPHGCCSLALTLIVAYMQSCFFQHLPGSAGCNAFTCSAHKVFLGNSTVPTAATTNYALHQPVGCMSQDMNQQKGHMLRQMAQQSS